MASLDGMPLTLAEGDNRNGVAFLLTRPSPVACRVEFDRLEVEIAENSRFILVRGVHGDGFVPVIRAGLTAALHGLDVLSVKGIVDLALTDTSDLHIAWRPGASGPVVSLYATTTVNTRVTASAVVTDAAGNVRPDPPDVFKWHASMRYYRQAQLVDDLSDAVRNLWLAVENLLDEIARWQSGESEGMWLGRALTVAASHVDLSHYLPPTSHPATTSAYNYFYDELRAHLFHAKGTRRPLLPAEFDGTNYLVERHERLTRLYLDLLYKTVGVRRSRGGGMTYAGFDVALEGLHVDSSLAMSDDASPVDASDKVINPTGGTSVSAPARFAPLLSRPGRHVFSSRMDHKEAATLDVIRRFGLLHSKALVASSSIEGVLNLCGIDGLRGNYALRLNNTENPRSFPAF